MKKFSKLILSIGFIAVLTLASCASFENRLVRKDRIKYLADSLNYFNMTFFSKSYKQIQTNQKFKSIETDLVSEVNRVIDKKDNSTLCKLYKLRFIGKDTLLVQGVGQNDSILVEYKFAGKLKNGFFNLDNGKVEYYRIPYLLGGSSSEKTRICLSKDRDLIVQTAVDNTGAFLLIVGTGYSYNKVTYFREIK